MKESVDDAPDGLWDETKPSPTRDRRSDEYRRHIREFCNIAAMPRRRRRPPVSLSQQPITLTMTGYEVVEKEAKPCATSGRVLVPHHWVGKRVRAVRLDP